MCKKDPKRCFNRGYLVFKITKSYVVISMRDNKKQSLLNISHVKR